MCTGLELAAVGALAGTAASSLMAPKTPSVTVPDATKPPEAAQATKAPDRSAIVTANAAAAGTGGMLGGNSGTFLTGPSGIDPSMLNLGKNKLLGQ